MFIKKIIDSGRLLFRINIIKTIAFKSKMVIFKKVHVGLEKKNNVSINKEGRLYLGSTFQGCGFFDSFLVLKENSNLIINGSFTIYSGFRISVNKNATLEIGSGYINYGANIACFEHIKIGKNVVISENVTIRDSDNHFLDQPNFNMTAPIEIGDNVWIGLNATILKGVKVGNGSVIGAGAVVTKDVPENCLVAGVPAKVIRNNVKWR